MDHKRFLKVLGTGGVAVLMISGVALGADAILRTPGAQAPVVLAADENVSPTETPDAAGTDRTVEPTETAEPTETPEPAKPVKEAKPMVASHRTSEHPKSTDNRPKSGHTGGSNDDQGSDDNGTGDGGSDSGSDSGGD